MTRIGEARVKRVYLAGPEVFLPRAEAIGREKKEIGREFGLEGLFPLDAEIRLADSDRAVDREGMAIEDFGLEDNLMMACAVELSGELVVKDDRGSPLPKSLGDLSAFRECVRRAAAYLSARGSR